VGNGTSVEQLPWLTVGIDAPAANHARIEEIQALLARPVDLSVRLADQDCLTKMNGYLRRTDVNLEWHDMLPSQRSIDRVLRIVLA
jgi:hypothetical protein